MAIPTTREEFKDHCLRHLGQGVIQINVTDDQIEDRIDEALYLFQLCHCDAVVTTFLQHQISTSTMTLVAPGNTFSAGEQVFGSVSHLQATVDRSANATSLLFYMDYHVSVAWEPGETITGQASGKTATLAANGIVLGDYDNKWVSISPNVIGITKIFPPYDARMTADILFDPQSQFSMSLLSNFTSNSIIPYFMGRTYQQLLNDVFRGKPGIRYKRHMNRLYLDVNWATTFRPYYYIIAECTTVIDPDEYPLIWSDRWLQRYGTALFKRQWGSNISKYNGISLPGGVKLDGQTILTEANAECIALEEELRTTYQEPIGFIVG